MARTVTKPNRKQKKSMEVALWESCNKLCGIVELADCPYNSGEENQRLPMAAEGGE